jgi:hypothetical protein
VLGKPRADLARESDLSEGLIKKYETGGPWTASATAVLRDTYRQYGIDVEIVTAAPPAFNRATKRL